MNISEEPLPALRRGGGGRRGNKLLGLAVEGGLWALLVLTPLALGSVTRTASVLLEGSCFVLLVLAWWAGREPGPSRVPAAFKGLAGAFVAWTLLQLVPLPPSLLGWVSPGTARLYEQNLPGYAQKSGRADLQSWLMQRQGTSSRDLEPRSGVVTGLEGKTRIAPGWKPVTWYPEETVRWLTRFLAYWSLFVLVVDFLPRGAAHHRIPWLLLLLGGAIAAEGLIQHLTWNGRIFWFIKVYQGHPYGPWVNSNHFSGYLEMVLPLGGAVLLQTVGRRSGSRHRRHSRRSTVLLTLLALVALACILTALPSARSRGGLFSLAFVAVLYFLLQMAAGRWRRRHPRLATSLAIVMVLAVVGAAIAYIRVPALRPATYVSDVEPSFASRVLAWKGVLAMAAANPLAGTGLGTFALAYPAYKTYGLTGVWRQAHNDYLQVLAESGLVGFCLLAAGIVLLSRRFFLPILRAPWRRPDPVGLGAALGVPALLFHSLVDFNLQIPANGLLFVVLGALLVRFGSSGRSSGEARDRGTADPEVPGNP